MTSTSDKVLIDFNDQSAGTIVNGQYASQGVTISSGQSGKPPMIFDTGNPTGGDWDLHTGNLGNVLILSEDGHSHDPDDNAGGGRLIFEFDTPSEVESLTLLDIDEGGGRIFLYDDAGTKIGEVDIPCKGNNSQQTLDIDTDGVSSMVVELSGSGAVDNLCFTPAQGGGPVDGTAGDDVMLPGFVDAQGDTIDGADGNDDEIHGYGGDDSIDAGRGDDRVFGGAGDDLLAGGTGANTLSGGQGDDVMVGGAGADTFFGGSGQDNLDYSDSAAAVTVDLSSGTLLGGDAQNDAIGGGIDGVIGSDHDDMLTGFDQQGTGGNDVFTNEFFGGKGDDSISAKAGDDLVYGGADSDTIDGGAGDDILYGGLEPGAGGTTALRESFEWDKLPDPNGSGGIDDGDRVENVTQNTGNVEVSFRVTSESSWRIDHEFSDDRILTGGIDTGTETIDADSGFKSDLSDVSHGCTSYEMSFDQPVENVDFRVNDADGSARVDIRAYDAEGNEIPVSFELGSGLGMDGTSGFRTDPAGSGAYGDQSDPDYSAQVQIAGPVARIEITHAEGAQNSAIWFTDVYFDAIVGTDPGTDAGDVIDGGDGDDQIFGEAGNDTLTGGAGRDTVRGGDDRDYIIGGTDGDLVDGGAGGDDHDILDLSGAGRFQVIDETTDPDGNSTSGTIQFLDDTNAVTGEMTFTEIEEIIGDRVAPDGCVDGTNGNDVMGVGYVDAQGDTIDGSDGVDDCIRGHDGDDKIAAGAGDDRVFGGKGNDTINGNDGDDTLFGDDGNDRMFGGEGADSIYGGAGNDTLSGNRGGDYLDGGAGDDTLNGDIAADTLVGGTGDDLLRGEHGGDTIFGGDGSDTADGGDGADYIDTSGPVSLDPADPTGKPDQGYPGLFAADDDPANDMDTVYGGGADDTIYTGDDDDSIDAGGGNDTVFAGVDDDMVEGGSGNDLIVGGEGNDTLSGGLGDDTIYGGLEDAFDVLNIKDDEGDLRPDNGDDVIFGGEGNDYIDGKDDSDVIYGGAGADTITGGIDDDTMYGDAGNDSFTDDHGADDYFGGDDRDSFDYSASSVDQADGDHVDGGTGGDDHDVLDLTGLGRFRKVDETTDADGDSTSGTIEFLDDDDNVTGTLTFAEIERIVPCFTPGTLIATMQGERRVEDLRAGDRIITRDNGAQEIRWIGRKSLSGIQLCSNRHLQPILIQAGSLGNGLPERDMLVSPNHRVLVNNSEVGLLFNEPEVLVAAKHLIDPPRGIVQVEASAATYVHMMFDHHEVVLSDGAWTESFQPGDQAMAGISQNQREEIFELFPELVGSAARQAYGAARLSLRKHEAEMLK